MTTPADALHDRVQGAMPPGARILAVDDRAASRAALRAILEADGFAVVEAADGVEALDVLARVPIDAVVSDIVMPRMDGLRLCREMRHSERLRHLPFLFRSSAFTAEADEQRCRDLGADGFLRGPAARTALEAAFANARTRSARHERSVDLGPVHPYSEQLVAALEDRNAELSAALARLQASEQKLQQIIHSEPECVKVVAPDGRLLDMNPAGLAMIEADSLEQVRGRALTELIAPAHRDAFRALHLRVVAGGTGVLEFEAIGLRGARRWLETHAVPLREDGRIVALLGITRDVTERVHAQRALRISEGRYRRLVESGSIGVIIANLDGRIVEANDCFLQMLGHSRADIASGKLDWLALTPPEWRFADERAIVELLATGAVAAYEKEYFHRDGRRIPIALRVAALDESPGDCLCLVADISDRRRAEEAVRDSERKLRQVMDGLGPNTLVGLLSLDGSVLLANRPALEAAGLRLEDVLGRPVEQTPWFAYATEVQAQVHAAVARAAAGEAVRFDVQIRIAADALAWIDLSINPLRDADGRVAYLVPSANVIEARKQTETELHALSGRLLQAQDEERRRLARELHDSTAQLLAALGMNLAVLAQRAGSLAPDQRRLLADCESLAQRGSTELRTLSYLLHPPALDSLGLVRAIEDYAHGFAQRSGLDVQLDLPEDLARLPEGVELALFRVLQESLGNVHRHAAASRVWIRLAHDANEVAIEVRDDGRGISATLLSAAPKGQVGVGIAGMRERVRLLGGRLDVEPGAPGTLVRATLPLHGVAP
jgi:PAS domain S-box-containing protein